jgi:hypothetical protein
MGGHYARRARSGEVIFDDRMQAVLVVAAREICTGQGWLPYQVRATPTHLHALVGWRAYVDRKDVSDGLKRRLGAALSKALDRKGPWFSRGGKPQEGVRSDALQRPDARVPAAPRGGVLARD